MNLRLTDFIQLFSVCSTLFPLVVCILIIKKGSWEFRLFFLFLIIGFLTDFSMYSLKMAQNYEYMEIFWSIYSLVEATFFYWLLSRYVLSKFKSALSVLYLITFFYWIVLAVLRISMGTDYFSVGQLFDPVYEVSISFISGFILLQMAEKEDSISDKPMFWIFIGIFFYCFSTFFIAAFLNTELSKDLWFLHNIFNIITLGFYTFGLWKYYRIQKLNTIQT